MAVALECTGSSSSRACQPPSTDGLPRLARRYFDYINFNATGYRPYVTTLYAVLLGCLRRALSRMLVLIVAMGFGVVLPYLGAVQKKARGCCASPCLLAVACFVRLRHGG